MTDENETPITIIRAKHGEEDPYYRMSRALSQNRKISFAARGVMSYLLSHFDHWQLQPKDLQQECGKNKVYSLLNELIESGYIVRWKAWNTKTKRIDHFCYEVYEQPIDPESDLLPQKLDTGKLEQGNSDIIYKRVVKKKEVKEGDSSAPKNADGKPTLETTKDSSRKPVGSGWEEAEETARGIALQCPTMKLGSCLVREDNSLACLECEWQDELPGVIAGDGDSTCDAGASTPPTPPGKPSVEEVDMSLFEGENVGKGYQPISPGLCECEISDGRAQCDNVCLHCGKAVSDKCSGPEQSDTPLVDQAKAMLAIKNGQKPKAKAKKPKCAKCSKVRKIVKDGMCWECNGYPDRAKMIDIVYYRLGWPETKTMYGSNSQKIMTNLAEWGVTLKQLENFVDDMKLKSTAQSWDLTMNALGNESRCLNWLAEDAKINWIDPSPEIESESEPRPPAPPVTLTEEEVKELEDRVRRQLTGDLLNE